MAQSSNPSFPSRFNAGSGSFSKGFADASPVRPPVLTAQGREDVERLRAKVRAHNPGYVYTNGVSLPSQLPSVPELLDELARNVAGAKVRGNVPATPLPEVEPSELAKAGFDWRAIADRAIDALEKGSHRPLPLANDPEAASIPGLSVIAATGTKTPEEPEVTSTEEPVAEEPLLGSVEDSVEQPQDFNPEFEQTPVTQPDSAVATDDVVAEEIPVFDEEIPDNFMGSITGSPVGEPMVHAPMEPLIVLDSTDSVEPQTDFEMNESPMNLTLETDLPVGVFEGEEELSQPDMEVAPPLPPVEEPYEMDTFEGLTVETGQEPEVELNDDVASAEEEAATGTLPQSDDLTENRVYDDEVLEPEGNDDELFVGDIEGKPATWEPTAEDASPALETDFTPVEANQDFPTEPEETTQETSLDDQVAFETQTLQPEESLAQEETTQPQELAQPEELVSADGYEEFAVLEELPESIEPVEAEQPQDNLEDSELGINVWGDQDASNFEMEMPQELPEDFPVEEPTFTLEETSADTQVEDFSDISEMDLDEPSSLLEETLPETIETEDISEAEVLDELELPSELEEASDTENPEETEGFSEETGETEIEDLDLADLDLDVLDEIPVEENPEEQNLEDVSELELDEVEPAEETDGAASLEETLGDTEEASFASFETDNAGELPGSAAIGSEAAESIEAEPETDELDGVDLGEFDFSDEEIPEALPEELPGEEEVEFSEGLPESLDSIPPSSPENWLDDDDAEALPVSSEELGEDGDSAALPFEIPQVQGDIPQAMQEGFPEWTPTAEAQFGTEEPPQGDESWFISENPEPDNSELTPPEEEKPAKKGFFQRLFGRK